MANRIRLGVAGLVHDHVWKELEQWAATGRVEFVAAGDPNPPLIERVRKQYGVERLFDDAEDMIEQVRPDVVQVCASNAVSAAIVQTAALHGVHAVVEKPMAATLAQADRMLAAARGAGTLLFINWPNRWRPNTLASWKLIAEGAIGHVFHARMRMAHTGPRELGCSEYFCDWLYDPSQNGGGALVDYCSYGAVAFRHLFGMPRAVQGVAARLVKTDVDVEDNAAITLIYDDRFAQAEASWSQIPSYHDAVYLGSTGTLWTDAGKVWIAREEGERTEAPVDPLPAGRRNGPECFLTCLDTGQQPADVCAADVCRDAQQILEAGLQSAETGTRITL